MIQIYLIVTTLLWFFGIIKQFKKVVTDSGDTKSRSENLTTLVIEILLLISCILSIIQLRQIF